MRNIDPSPESSNPEPSLVEPTNAEEPRGPRHLTQSQASAFTELARLYELRGHTESYGGFVPRVRPLLVGPSGVGKSSVVTRLADTVLNQGDVVDEGLLALNAGTWIPIGSLAKPTLTVLRKFIRNHRDGGIIFIDQAHQCAPQGAAAYSHHWSMSITSEILDVIDGADRLISAGWSAADIDHLRRDFFTVAASTQILIKTHPRWAASGYGLPEEISKRFNRPIVMELPTAKDFTSAIHRVYADFGLSTPRSEAMKPLVESAIASRTGMRWVEQYVCVLAASHGLKAKPIPPPESKSKKKLISADAFAEMQKNTFRIMEEAEPLIALAEAHYKLLAADIFKVEIAPALHLAIDGNLTSKVIFVQFRSLQYGLGYRFTTDPLDQLAREQCFWRAGRVMQFFFGHMLDNQVSYLNSHKILGLTANAQVHLTRAMWSWLQLTEHAIDD